MCTQLLNHLDSRALRAAVAVQYTDAAAVRIQICWRYYFRDRSTNHNTGKLVMLRRRMNTACCSLGDGHPLCIKQSESRGGLEGVLVVTEAGVCVFEFRVTRWKKTTAKMREIVHIQAGQCGNQIGAKVRYGCWSQDIEDLEKVNVDIRHAAYENFASVRRRRVVCCRSLYNNNNKYTCVMFPQSVFYLNILHLVVNFNFSTLPVGVIIW